VSPRFRESVPRLCPGDDSFTDEISVTFG
jgi:hypothetical protein